MKKIVIFALVLTFIICVVSCGKNGADSTTDGGVVIVGTTTAQTATTKEIDATEATYPTYEETTAKFDIIQIITDFDTSIIYGKMSDEDKAEFEANCNAVGMGVTFYDNGEMRMIDMDGTVYIQYSNGTWDTAISGETMYTTTAEVVIYSKLSDAEKQAFVEKCAKEGKTVEFLANGETKITDKDGNISVQMDNGLWYYPGK